MKRLLISLLGVLCLAYLATAQNVTIRAVDQPAASVFRSIVEQTGKNFVYSSDLLKDIRVTVNAENKPLKRVLSEMFSNTTIEYKIKGNNIVLKRKKARSKVRKPQSSTHATIANKPVLQPNMLQELIVVSRLESPAVETAEIGAKKVTAEEVRKTPALFGEADVIKALHTQPGVTAGAEGMS